jgi:hypothetical protein
VFKPIVLSVAALLALPSVTFGQAVLKPNGEDAVPLRLKSLDARVTIDGPVATSTWTYIYEHGQSRRFEADFLYKLGEKQLATGLAYWYGDEKVVAHVVEKERAREIYEHITSRLRDPALIEFVGNRSFRARIFPIEPNKDLKIEMKFVEALSADAKGLSIRLPIEQPKGSPVDTMSVHVSVKGDGLQVANNYGLQAVTRDGGATLSFSGADVRPDKDLSIRIEKPSRLAMGFKSGGDSGFFAWVIPSGTVKPGQKIQIEGVDAFDVMPRSIPSSTTGGVLVVGRYRRPGVASLKIGGASLGTASFSSNSIPNHGAVKLWAAKKIEALGNDKKAIVPISIRHTLPSKFTSWLAIPMAERKIYERDKAREEIYDLAKDIVTVMERDGLKSPKLAQLRQLFNQKLKIAEIDSGRWAFYDAAYSTQTRLAKELSAGRDRSKRALRAREALMNLPLPKGQREEMVDRAYEMAMYDMAEEYVANKLALDRSASARSQAARFEKLAKQMNSRSNVDEMVEQYQSRIVARQAEVLAAAEWKSGPKSKAALAARKRLENMRRVVGPNAVWMISDGKRRFYHQEYETRGFELGEAVAKQLSPASIANRRRAFQRITDFVDPVSYANIALQGIYQYESGAIDKLFKLREAGKGDSPEATKIHNRLAGMASQIGVPTERLLYHADSYQMDNLMSQLRWGELTPRRNLGAIAVTRTAIEILYRKWMLDSSKLDADFEKVMKADEGGLSVTSASGYTYHYSYNYSYNGPYRDELVKELHRPNPDWSKVAQLERLYKEAHTGDRERAQRRLAVIRAETELDRLDQMELTPELAAKKRELEERAKELRARMGDPLVIAEFPKHAKNVVALLPDGTLQPLTWHDQRNRWETRFDIPTYVKEGEVAVVVYASLPDGRRLAERFTYTVDLTAAKLDVELSANASKLSLRVIASSDNARISAWLPYGERIDLTRQPLSNIWTGQCDLDGRNLLGEVLVVATDKAHNKSEVRKRLP